jgi:two-component system, LytTR family, sensor kinase
MPAPELDLHGNHWINTVGHSAGVVVFANLGWLLYRDAQRSQQTVRALPIVSTTLALAFDLFLLSALGFRERDAYLANAFAALAFGALSLLPAVLLDICLQGNNPKLRMAGYLLGATCAVLHGAEIFIDNERVHSAALLSLSIGFAILSVLSIAEHRKRPESPAAAGYCLLALSLSFLHFLAGAHQNNLWTELILHHAGIPIALIVILEEYRFLLLDAFLRLLTSGALATAAVASIWTGRVWIADRLRQAQEEPFSLGSIFVLLAAAFLGFSYLRNRAQQWLTRSVFLRPDPRRVEEEIRRLEGNEEAVREGAARLVADYFRAESWRWEDKALAGYDAQKRVRFLKGDSLYLHLGGRRFLSEDLETLESFAAAIAREVDRARTRELERLMLAAELRALQSQIHPHFLFNALNALYGSIPRAAADARRLVLSLSEVFRYFLTTSKATARLEDELRIIEAYLEIEKARLGPRLRTELAIEESCLRAEIPVLTIQPLVENAVKHGVAALPGPGDVTLRVSRAGEAMTVTVEDSGPGFAAAGTGAGETPGSNRVGLENVRRRLELHYGTRARLQFERRGGRTCVILELPAGEENAAAHDDSVAAQGKSL